MEQKQIKSHVLNSTGLFLANMEVHEKLRTIRQSKGYTQDFIAERLRIDTVNYGRIERGQAKLTVDRFKEICTLLGVHASTLLEDNSMGIDQNKTLLEQIYEEIKQINNKLQ